MIAGLLGGAAYGASIYFGSVAAHQQMWIEASRVTKLIREWGDYDEFCLTEAEENVGLSRYWAGKGQIPSRQVMERQTRLMKMRGEVEVLRTSYREADAAFQKKYGVSALEMSSVNRPRLPKRCKGLLHRRGTLARQAVF